MSTKPASATDAPPARLVRFRVDHSPAGEGPSFHSLGPVNLDTPHEQLIGWSIAVRGAAVFFVSPRGWSQGRSARELDGNKGEVRIIEIPRQDVTFVWAGDDPALVDKLQRFDVGPIARKALPSDERAPAIDPKELGDQ